MHVVDWNGETSYSYDFKTSIHDWSLLHKAVWIKNVMDSPNEYEVDNQVYDVVVVYDLILLKEFQKPQRLKIELIT